MLFLFVFELLVKALREGECVTERHLPVSIAEALVGVFFLPLLWPSNIG